MQGVFPEGNVFTNALYALSWCELAMSDLSNKQLKERAMREALFAYKEINSDKAKSIFDHYLIPQNGIYYIGWKNYLLSKILILDINFVGHQEYKNAFKMQCDTIVGILKRIESPYLQSYEGQAWPADMFVAMASVSNHDRIFTPQYSKEINNWIGNVKQKLDPKTNMIPHKVDPMIGGTIEGARGSSISLILRLLSEIDVDFTDQQYELYKTNFVTTTFGLPSIREYPKGQDGRGDIDSGPVIFGVGFAGTIVSIGVFSLFGDGDLTQRQYQTINAFGFETYVRENKKYIFGLLPIADAFITWGRASGLNNKNWTEPLSKGWRIKFHLISILVFMILWPLFYSKSIIGKMKSDRKS